MKEINDNNQIAINYCIQKGEIKDVINPNGAWQARSDGGLWEFQSPKDIESQIEDSPNTVNCDYLLI